MNEDTTYTGFEPVETGPFEPTKQRFNYHCDRCGHDWHKLAYAVPKKNPKCPNRSCVEIAELADLRTKYNNLERMLLDGRAPAHIGANTTVKAVDYTANAVMEDYKLTDLKDGIRQGEDMAPKLPPAQQQQADNYFVGAPAPAGQPATGPTGFRDTKVADFKTGRPHTIKAKQMEMLGRRAIAGAFRGMAVAPTAVVPEAAKQIGSPIVRVRTESNPGYTGPR